MKKILTLSILIIIPAILNSAIAMAKDSNELTNINTETSIIHNNNSNNACKVYRPIQIDGYKNYIDDYKNYYDFSPYIIVPAIIPLSRNGMLIDAILIHIPSATMTKLYKGRVVSMPNFNLSSLYALNPADGSSIPLLLEEKKNQTRLYEGSKSFRPGYCLKMSQVFANYPFAPKDNNNPVIITSDDRLIPTKNIEPITLAGSSTPFDAVLLFNNQPNCDTLLKGVHNKVDNWDPNQISICNADGSLFMKYADFTTATPYPTLPDGAYLSLNIIKPKSILSPFSLTKDKPQKTFGPEPVKNIKTVKFLDKK
jgi:hypothetical protein